MRLGWALRLACWAGLAAGVGEFTYLALRRHVRDLLLFQGSDPNVYWVSPVANASLFVLLIGVLALLARWWPRLFRPAAVVGALAFLLTTSMLLLIPPLHPGAVLLLGLGVGVQAGRLLPRYESALARVVNATLPAGLVLVVVTAIAVPLVRWSVTQRAEHRLVAARAGAPNVLLIILDTVRALNLSVYGYQRPTTPALERWASRGVRFQHAFSAAPWTLPSHASIFTGREAHELSANWQTALDGTYPTLAEALLRNGYRTGGFVANVAYTSRETGLGRGFITYDDYQVNFDRFVSSASITRWIVDPRAVRRIFWGGDMLGRKRSPLISREFLAWAAEDSTRPFFAFLNYYDAHVPYLPPAPYRGRFREPDGLLEPNLIRVPSDTVPWSPEQVRGLETAYDGALAYLDAEIDSLFVTLDRRGMLANTLVILTSDHGEEFNEHGVILHGNTLYRPSVEVPLMIWFPDRVPSARVVVAPVTNRQIPATVLDLLGIADRRFPGPSLAEAWRDRRDAPRPGPIFTSVRHAWQIPAWYPVAKGDMVAVADSGFRLIRDGGGNEELYDEGNDPLEQHNLLGAREHEATVARLRRMIDEATKANHP